MLEKDDAHPLLPGPAPAPTVDVNQESFAWRAAKHVIKRLWHAIQTANWPVFVVFCGCLVVFLRALSGQGYEGDLVPGWVPDVEPPMVFGDKPPPAAADMIANLTVTGWAWHTWQKFKADMKADLEENREKWVGVGAKQDVLLDVTLTNSTEWAQGSALNASIDASVNAAVHHASTAAKLAESDDVQWNNSTSGLGVDESPSPVLMASSMNAPGLPSDVRPFISEEPSLPTSPDSETLAKSDFPFIAPPTSLLDLTNPSATLSIDTYTSTSYTPETDLQRLPTSTLPVSLGVLMENTSPPLSSTSLAAESPPAAAPPLQR